MENTSGSAPYNGRDMLAVLAVRTDPADPLAGLAVAERDEPRPPEGWELVSMFPAHQSHEFNQDMGVDTYGFCFKRALP